MSEVPVDDEKDVPGPVEESCPVLHDAYGVEVLLPPAPAQTTEVPVEEAPVTEPSPTQDTPPQRSASWVGPRTDWMRGVPDGVSLADMSIPARTSPVHSTTGWRSGSPSASPTAWRPSW
ncbi:hypothetical protein [Embleya sp. AB8]|uniref:hypothetical protein n=1 Tax=Embleya sp. AB8 TaxID=3156304 RepID=UPI003C72B61B